LLIVSFVIIIACSTALMLMLVGTGRDAVARGGILGAAVGLLGAILNGPRPKSRRENPSVWTLLGRILLLALGFLPGGAVLGVLVGGIYGGLGTGSTVVRVIGSVVSGAVLGGVATILVTQVASATAAAIGAVRGHWKRHLLVEMADGAKGILFEGGIALVVPGLCIGTLVGIILALVGV
jgi:hypothetical protein